MGASARQLLPPLDDDDDVKGAGAFLRERARIKSSAVSSTQAKRRLWQRRIAIHGARRNWRQGRLFSRMGTNPRVNGMGRRVKTLKKLIPNGESMGIHGLFRETADYILALEMRVRVMQVMVNLLAEF